MDIDEWAAQAPDAGPADDETPEEWASRLAEMRALSIRNDAANPWSHPHRTYPVPPEPCPDCHGRKTITERAWGSAGMMTSECTCLGCNGTGVKEGL